MASPLTPAESIQFYERCLENYQNDPFLGDASYFHYVIKLRDSGQLLLLIELSSYRNECLVWDVENQRLRTGRKSNIQSGKSL